MKVWFITETSGDSSLDITKAVLASMGKYTTVVKNPLIRLFSVKARECTSLVSTTMM